MTSTDKVPRSALSVPGLVAKAIWHKADELTRDIAADLRLAMSEQIYLEMEFFYGRMPHKDLVEVAKICKDVPALLVRAGQPAAAARFQTLLDDLAKRAG